MHIPSLRISRALYLSFAAAAAATAVPNAGDVTSRGDVNVEGKTLISSTNILVKVTMVQKFRAMYYPHQLVPS